MAEIVHESSVEMIPARTVACGDGHTGQTAQTASDRTQERAKGGYSVVAGRFDQYGHPRNQQTRKLQ
jgi:hypothetical protein